MPADEVTMAPAEQVLDEAGLDGLISALAAQGYQVIGPTVRDNAIVLAELSSAPTCPRAGGWTPARALPAAPPRRPRRCSPTPPGRGPGSSSCTRPGGGCGPPRRAARSNRTPRRRRGTRSSGCAAATWPPSRSWAGYSAAGPAPMARSRRTARHLFIVAVNCTEPGGVCFCASMGTGPGRGPGYDLALTERDRGRPAHLRRRRGQRRRARRYSPGCRTARPTRPR